MSNEVASAKVSSENQSQEESSKMSYAELAVKVAVMESDIKTVISILTGLFDSLGINEEMFQGASDISSALPAIIGKLSREMMMGSFNTQAFAEAQAIMPIIEKYKHLSSNV